MFSVRLEFSSMSRLAYVDGRFVPIAQGRCSINDRGYQFSEWNL
jgi:hypothetical protein